MSKPVRVAFVVHLMQVAGAEVLVRETIRQLKGRIQPTIFCLDAVGRAAFTRGREAHSAEPLEEQAPGVAAEDAAQRYEEARHLAAQRAGIAWALTVPLFALMLAHTALGIVVPGAAIRWLHAQTISAPAPKIFPCASTIVVNAA